MIGDRDMRIFVGARELLRAAGMDDPALIVIFAHMVSERVSFSEAVSRWAKYNESESYAVEAELDEVCAAAGYTASVRRMLEELYREVFGYKD